MRYCMILIISTSINLNIVIDLYYSKLQTYYIFSEIITTF